MIQKKALFNIVLLFWINLVKKYWINRGSLVSGERHLGSPISTIVPTACL